PQRASAEVESGTAAAISAVATTALRSLPGTFIFYSPGTRPSERSFVAPKTNRQRQAWFQEVIDAERSSPGARRYGSTVPGLNDGLLRDLSAFEIEHRRAKHLGAVRIGAALGEGQPIACGDSVFDHVGHVATTNVAEIAGDRSLARQPARIARRVVVI